MSKLRIYISLAEYTIDDDKEVISMKSCNLPHRTEVEQAVCYMWKNNYKTTYDFISKMTNNVIESCQMIPAKDSVSESRVVIEFDLKSGKRLTRTVKDRISVATQAIITNPNAWEDYVFGRERIRMAKDGDFFAVDWVGMDVRKLILNE